ncbi:MAG: T9SS type A sorting domain-containing protein [Bacteroidia bacterium]|nr:T9SS type A sorting domain-containing protein [Bacteroidia bacterium]
MRKTQLLAAFAFVFSALTAQIPTTGLIGKWEFSGNANDGSSSANHGTVNGALLTTDRCGHANSAYVFNGSSDYIHMLLAGPSGAAPRSVSFWARTNKSTISNSDIMAVFGYGEFANAKGWSIHYNYNCVGIGCDVHNEAYTCGANCLTDNNWHHIAVVFDTGLSAAYGTMVYYVDGVQLPGITCVITGTSQTVNTGTVLPIEIGKVHDDMGRYFQGSLDDFYLYDRAINSNEVQQLYYACMPAITGPTVVCRGTSNVFAVPPMPGATSYTWITPSGWIGTSSTNTISLTTNSSVFTVTLQVLANSTCGGLDQKSEVFSIKVVSTCADINENNIISQVNVFPNPSTTSAFTIQTESEMGIKIYNMLGALILEKKLIKGDNSIDLKSFGKGLYFGHVSNQKGKGTVKLIVE